MPYPAVAVGVVALIARLTPILRSKWTWMSVGYAASFVTNIYDEIKKWVVVEMAERAGLILDREDPLSDASLTNAVTGRTGIPLRTFKDKVMIEEDLDDFASARLSEKIGFTISTIRDTSKARADFEVAALAIISQKTGIPFVIGANGLDVAEIKEQVTDWARAAIAVEMAQSAGAALEAMGQEGVDFEALAADMNGKLTALGSGESVNSGLIALRLAESMVQTSIDRLQVTVIGASKKGRRALQVRAAQQRFRSRHGNRQQYVPLGMGAVIS